VTVITVKEVAEILRVKSATVYAWAEQGRIPTFKANGARRFIKEDIMAWVKDCVASSDRYNSDTGRRPKKGGIQ